MQAGQLQEAERQQTHAEAGRGAGGHLPLCQSLSGDAGQEGAWVPVRPASPQPRAGLSHPCSADLPAPPPPAEAGPACTEPHGPPNPKGTRET